MVRQRGVRLRADRRGAGVTDLLHSETAAHVVDDLFDRIDALDRPEIFVDLRPREDVRRDHAASIAAGGPLAGRILVVKNNVDVAGLPTTAACPGFGRIAATDAPAVAALTSAGAVVLGTTNLDQFATGLVGTRSPHGAVRDSRRPEFISGGSSSGSAVAVALGVADIAIGTDTAGSGRIPAALQGIVGIKPTIGVVSTEGVVPACASYDCVTILARDVATADAAMAAMAAAGGPRPFPADLPLAAPAVPVVAVPADLPAMDGAWRDAFQDAIARCRDLGWTVREIPIDHFLAAAALLYDGALVAERYDAVGEYVDEALSDHRVGALDSTVATIISAAGRFSAVDLLADRRRVTELRTAAMAHVEGCDAMVVPTAPFHPSIAEVAADPVATNARMGTYTNFCNLFDLAAIAVPADPSTTVTVAQRSSASPCWPRHTTTRSSSTSPGGSSATTRRPPAGPRRWPRRSISPSSAHTCAASRWTTS
ncbi:hypothetical protein GCM10009722_25490 [Williamsia deligens]